MDVAANPADANEVHIAGIHTWKSLDGGSTFALSSYWTPNGASSRGVGYNHADIDILKYTGSTLYVGSDGGLYTSTDKASSFVDRSQGLGIRQFYKIGVSKTDPNVVSGGAQDNGTSVMKGVNRDWSDWLGADGMESFVDWSNSNNLYGTSQNGSLYKSTNGGSSYSGITKPAGDGGWVTPFEQDPSDAATIYAGYIEVWKSIDKGSNWTQISSFGGSNLANLKIAPSNNQYLYASQGSTLRVTSNGGGNWNTYSNNWGGGTVKYMTVHPRSPSRLVIVTSSGVYESSDAGVNWSEITGNLPSGTKYCAVYESNATNGIYVGGFGTLYYTNDNVSGWVSFMDGLPNVRVYELEINTVSNSVFACTFGRGLWESPLYTEVVSNKPSGEFKADVLTGCEGMTVQFTDTSSNTPTSWSWTFANGTPSTSTQQNPQVQFNSAGSFDVSLTATNTDGSGVTSKSGYVVVDSPVATQIDNVARCGIGNVDFIVSPGAGETVNWYNTSSGGVAISVQSTYAPSISQNTTYYYSVIKNGCESARLSVEGKIVDPGVITSQDETICEPGGLVTLTATSSIGGSVYWYDVAVGGASVANGTSYPVTISATTEYYVLSSTQNPSLKVGLSNNVTATGGSHAGGYYLVFDATTALTIVSAKVYATGAKDRAFELRDAAGVLLEQKIVSVPDGESTVNLGFNVSVGTNLQLGVASGADLFRSNNNVNYPYGISGLIDITTSTAGLDYYYYLYDIEVLEDGACESDRVSVKAIVDVCTGVDTQQAVDLEVFPNPAQNSINIKGVGLSTVQITDATGKVVYTSNVVSDNLITNVSAYKSGVYSVLVTYVNGLNEMIKFVKE